MRLKQKLLLFLAISLLVTSVPLEVLATSLSKENSSNIDFSMDHLNLLNPLNNENVENIEMELKQESSGYIQVEPYIDMGINEERKLVYSTNIEENLIFESQDTSIITIENEVIKAHKSGSTTIIVKSANGDMEAKTQINVYDKPELITKSHVTLKGGKSYRLKNNSSTEEISFSYYDRGNYDYVQYDQNGDIVGFHMNEWSYGQTIFPNGYVVITVPNSTLLSFSLPPEMESLLEVREVSEPALTKMQVKPNETIRITNIDTDTSQLDLDIGADLWQFECYVDRVLLNEKGEVSGFSEESPLVMWFSPGYTMVITNSYTAPITFYVPATKATIESSSQPAFTDVLFKAGKSYQIKYSGAHNFFQLFPKGHEDEHNYRTFADYIHFTGIEDLRNAYMYEEINRIYLDTANLSHIMFYEDIVYRMPYAWLNQTEITELAHPVLYKVDLNPFETIELINNRVDEDDWIRLYHNAWEQSSRALDYTLYYYVEDKTEVDTEVDYKAEYDYWGPCSLSLSSKGDRILVTSSGEEPVTLWVPYFQKEDLIVTELQQPVLYKFTVKPGESYQIQNQHETDTIILDNTASKSEGKYYNYELFKSNGSTDTLTQTDQKLYLSSGATATITVDETSKSSITFYTPYEYASYLIGGSSLGTLVEKV